MWQGKNTKARELRTKDNPACHNQVVKLLEGIDSSENGSPILTDATPCELIDCVDCLLVKVAADMWDEQGKTSGYYYTHCRDSQSEMQHNGAQAEYRACASEL